MTEPSHVETDQEENVLEERRKSDRPAPGKKTLLRHIGAISNPFISIFDRGWKGLVAMAVMMTVSVTTIYFSLAFRLPKIDSRNAQIARIEALEEEVGSLKLDWSQDDLTDIMERSKELEANVFPDYKQVAQWLHQETDNAKSLGLTLKYKLGSTVPLVEVNPILQLPIDFSLEVNASDSKNGYDLLLQSLDKLNSTSWQHQLLTADIESAGTGARKMDATLSFLLRAPDNYESDVKLDSENLIPDEPGML